MQSFVSFWHFPSSDWVRLSRHLDLHLFMFISKHPRLTHTYFLCCQRFLNFHIKPTFVLVWHSVARCWVFLSICPKQYFRHHLSLFTWTFRPLPCFQIYLGICDCKLSACLWCSSWLTDDRMVDLGTHFVITCVSGSHAEGNNSWIESHRHAHISSAANLSQRSRMLVSFVAQIGFCPH